MNFNIQPIKLNIPRVGFKSSNNVDKPQDPTLERSPKQDDFKISVGYVNDLHGQTNNMMRVLSGIKGDLKLSAGDNDIGDEKNQGVRKATTKFLNIAEIKASALGNHELDTTQQDCIEAIKNYDGDFLCVNYKKEPLENQDEDDIKKLGRAELDKHLKKSKIVEVKGEKIGLVGASPQDMFERLTHPNYYTDSTIDSFEDTIDEIQDEVDDLREEGVNKIFLLSHLGHKKDQIVAQSTDGIDVIIGGHTHELIKDIKEGKNLLYSKTGEPVVLTEAGRDGNFFGNLNLTFDKDGVIKKAQNNLGETRFFHKNMINQYVFDFLLGKPEIVGYVKEAPPPPKSLLEENPHANFVCDVMRETTDSDIALWHNCGVRGFFHEGVVDSSEIKDMSPFLDYVAVANVSEKSLVDMFKNAIETSYKSAGNKPGLIAVSGLNYTVDPIEGKLLEMNFINKDGKELKLNIDNPSEDKTFRLVTDEFLMSAGADFKILAEEDDYLEKFNYDKDVMTCQYIKEKGEPLVINQTGRIKFRHDD